MEIVENRALLLNVQHPHRITAVIPKSKVLSDNSVLVKWDHDSARVLNNLRIKNVPSPILGQYKWPGTFPPFDHQKTTAAFLTLNQKAFCFNEQGVGKTASAIWASDYLLTIGVIKRVLVVCPLSIMDTAWKGDLFQCAMHRRVEIAYGTADKRRAVIASDAQYVIINYDGIAIVREEIANGGFDLIIVDEANFYKNPQTDRWKTLNSLVTPQTWLWMMTGTPAAQSPVDAFGLAKLVNPKAVPKYMGAFKEMVMTKISSFRWIPKTTATKIVFQVLQPAIRFTKEECLDLPDMIYVKRDAPLSPPQEKYYKILKKQMMMVAAGQDITAPNAAIVLNKLLQISCGSVYTDNHDTVAFDITGRYKVLKEVIDEASQKVLVFIPFKHTIAILAERLTADGISCACISGDVSVANRTKIFNDFQGTPNPQVLLIQPQAAAHGVTLTAANTVVWWGPVPSLETYAQANARVHRTGQKHPCTVIQLQGSPVEKYIYSLLDNRISVHAKLIDMYKQIVA